MKTPEIKSPFTKSALKKVEEGIKPGANRQEVRATCEAIAGSIRSVGQAMQGLAIKVTASLVNLAHSIPTNGGGLSSLNSEDCAFASVSDAAKEMERWSSTTTSKEDGGVVTTSSPYQRRTWRRMISLAILGGRDAVEAFADPDGTWNGLRWGECLALADRGTRDASPSREKLASKTQEAAALAETIVRDSKEEGETEIKPGKARAKAVEDTILTWDGGRAPKIDRAGAIWFYTQADTRSPYGEDHGAGASKDGTLPACDYHLYGHERISLVKMDGDKGEGEIEIRIHRKDESVVLFTLPPSIEVTMKTIDSAEMDSKLEKRGDQRADKRARLALADRTGVEDSTSQVEKSRAYFEALKLREMKAIAANEKWDVNTELRTKADMIEAVEHILPDYDAGDLKAALNRF